MQSPMQAQMMQQQFMMCMMQQQQQQCMMMMAPMMAQMMGTGMMGGCSGCGVPDAAGEDSEETQRRLGQQVMANTMAALSRRETQDDVNEGDDGIEEVAPGPSSNV